MGQIIVKTKRLQMRGGEGVDFQAIRDDNGVHPEYHAFMTIEVKAVTKDEFQRWVRKAKRRYTSRDNDVVPLELAQAEE